MKENSPQLEEFVRAPHSKEHIDTQLPSYHMLEGEYRSFLLGKSEDYEDLREYQVGDSIRDIDWRATARMSEPVIRRFRQEKKHDIVFLIDSGRNMLGVSPSYETKQRLALKTAGALINIALQHQDTVKVAYVSSGKIISPNSTSSAGNLNTILNGINALPIDDRSKGSEIEQLINYSNKVLKKASIIVVVSDDYSVLPSQKELTILSQRHHTLWISIEDCPAANFDVSREYVDILTYDVFPTQIRTDPKIVGALEIALKEQNQKIYNLLSETKSNHISIFDEDSIIPSLYKLLHESSQERR